MKVSLRITENQFNELKDHLHCGDGHEAIAFGLCGRLTCDEENFLSLHKLHLIPLDQCLRGEDYVTWKTEQIEQFLTEVSEKGFALVKFHSHFFKDSDFSELDNRSDLSLFDSVFSWADSDLPHASVIMYPDGTFRGRVIGGDLSFVNLNSISIIGDSILKYNYCDSTSLDSKFYASMDRNKQAFGELTVETLKNMKIAVVGCSGTGSPTIEQLVRLGVGQLVLVDPDRGELANMNRIFGLTAEDALNNELKVDAIKNHIKNIGLDTDVKVFPLLVQENQKVIDELASCDLIFGCVDSAEGRYYLNLIGHYYLVPIIDIGVKLSADGLGGISSINGNIHYVYPGSASLMERKVFSSRMLGEEEIKRVSPEEYKNRKVYFENADVVSPAVISVNTLHSALAVCEMLSRIHPYRFNENSKYGFTHVNLSDWDIYSGGVGQSNSRFFSSDTLGIGDKQPKIQVNV